MEIFPSSWLAGHSAAATRRPSRLHRDEDDDAASSSRTLSRGKASLSRRHVAASSAEIAAGGQPLQTRRGLGLAETLPSSRRRVVAAAGGGDAGSPPAAPSSTAGTGEGLSKKKKRLFEEGKGYGEVHKHCHVEGFNDVFSRGHVVTEKGYRRQAKGREQLEKKVDAEEESEQEEKEELETERRRLLEAARDVVAAVGDRGGTGAVCCAEDGEEVTEQRARSRKRKEKKEDQSVQKKMKKERTVESKEVVPAAVTEPHKKTTAATCSSDRGRAAAESVTAKPQQQQQQKETEELAAEEEEFDLNIIEAPADTLVQTCRLNTSADAAAKIITQRSRDVASAAVSRGGHHSSSNSRSRSSGYAAERSNVHTRRDNTENIPSVKRAPASSAAAAAHCPPLFLSRRASLTVPAAAADVEEKAAGHSRTAATAAPQANGFVAAAARTRKGESRDKQRSLPPHDKQLLQRQIPKMLPFDGAERRATVSVALPASIIENAQTQELQAALVGQIARTLTVFGVDEIIIYEDIAAAVADSKRADHFSRALVFFVRNLEYLETPQYLRKSLFPLHPDLRYAGLQSPLDAPHHLRRCEWLPYREGSIVSSAATLSSTQNNRKETAEKKKQQDNTTYKSNKGREIQRENEEDEYFAARRRSEQQLLKEVGGSWVECGLPCRVWIPQTLPCNTRVTVRLDLSARQQLKRQQQKQQQQQRQQHRQQQQQQKHQQEHMYMNQEDDDVLKGCAVSPDEPPREAGLYWGYRIRAVHHFEEIFSGCPFSADGKYDLTIGTSERGATINSSFSLPSFRHLLLVLGSLHGLEAVVADRQAFPSSSSSFSSSSLSSSSSKKTAVEQLFSFYLNTCEQQRSRTIRTEEALPISLSLLRPFILSNNSLAAATADNSLAAAAAAAADDSLAAAAGISSV